MHGSYWCNRNRAHHGDAGASNEFKHAAAAAVAPQVWTLEDGLTTISGLLKNMLQVDEAAACTDSSGEREHT